MSTLTLSPPSSVDRKSPTPPNRAEDEGDSDGEIYPTDRATPVLPHGTSNSRKMSPAVAAQQQHQQQKSPPPAGVRNNAASRIALIKTAFEKTGPLKSSGKMNNRSSLSPVRRATSQQRSAFSNAGQDKKVWSSDHKNNHESDETLLALKNGGELVSRITSKLQELSTTATPPTSADGRPAIKKKPLLPPHKPSSRVTGHIVACNPELSRAQPSPTSFPPANCQLNGTAIQNGNSHRYSQAIKTATDSKFASSLPEVRSNKIVYDEGAGKKSSTVVQTEKGRLKSQTNNSAAALPPLAASINSADAPVSQHITRRSLPTSLGLLSSSSPELVPVSSATQAEHHNSDAVSNANSTSEVSVTSADDAGLINNSGSAGDRSPIPELGLQEFRSHVERFHSARALFSNMEKQQTPTMPNAPLPNVSSPNKSPSKNFQTNVINTTDVGKTPVVSNTDVTTSTFPVILSTPLSSASSVAASQVSLVKFMAQHYVEMIQQQSSPSSSNSNTSMQNQSINSGSVPLDADLLHQQHVAKVTDAANASAYLVAESVAVPISRADKTVSHGSQITDYDMQQSTIPEHLPAVRMAPVVDFQQHVVNSVLLGSAVSDNFDAANMLPNEDVVADDFQPVQRQFKRRLSFDTVSDDVAAHSDQQQEQVDTLRRSEARQQQRAEPPSSEFPVHHASHVDGSFPNSSHAMEDDLNTSFSTHYSTDSLNTSIQSSPHSGKQRIRQHQQQQQALAASLSSSFSTDNISSTSRTSKNLDELTLEDFAEDDLALMSNEDRQQLFDRGVKTEESFALARRESLKGSRRGDSTKDKANISANDSLVMDSVVIAGDDGLTAEPYDSEMEAIDRLLDNDDLNSSNHMPWDEEEDELTPTTTPGEGTLTKQARKSFSPLPPVEDVHDGAAHSAERAEKFETDADEDREQEFSQYHVDVANSAEPTLFNIADVIGDTNRFKSAFEQYEVVNYREDGHFWVEVPGLQPEVDDDEIVGTDNDAESYNSGDENGDVTFVKNDAENIGEPTSAADSTFTADTQPADIILNDSSSYNKTKNHDALDYGRASIVNDGSGAAARLERAVLRHRAAAKVKFSSGPIRVYSTFTGDEYDRRNSAIDPVAASAEWELEKRIEKMDVFDCVMERGEDEGLGVAIIGMGVGADIGLEKLGIFIKRVNEGGPAARLSEPGIRVGDQLIEVDGQSLVGVSQAYAAQVLRACGPVVNFRVGRDKDEQGEIAQLITAARQRDQQQQQPQMMVEEHREDDYGESTSQVDDIDHSEMKSDDEDNVAGSRFSEAETDSLKSRNDDDDDDDDAHAGEYDIESAEVRHEHRQNAAGTETSELEPVTVRVTPMDEDAVEYNVQSDSLTSPSATTTRSTSQDNYGEVKTTENMSSSAVGNKPPELPNKLALPVLVQRKNASFDAGSGDATAGKPLDGIGGVAATAAADGSTNLNKLESLSNVSVASSVINGMLNDHSEDLERLQTLYEEALLRSQIAENEVDLLKDKLETVQKTQAAQAAVAAAAVSEEEQEQRRLQVDANERQVAQLRAAEERARAAQTVLEELKSQLNEKQSQLALVERKYQKAKRLMREFRHRMQSIERQYEERVKRLEIQLQEQRRGSSSGAATADGVTETVKNYADITDETADDDDDMSVTLSTDITMSDVCTLNRSIETNNVVVFKSSTTTTTTTSATKSQDIFAAPVLQQHDLLDATAARHRIELAYKGLLGQRQPPSRISYTASCSSDGGIADTNNNDIVNALAATSSSSSGKVGAEGMRLEQEVRALLLSGMQTAEKAVGDNIPPPAITTANSGENKPSLRGILPTSEAPPLPVKSGSLIARVTRAVQHQLHPSSVAPPTTKAATEVSSSSTTTTTTGTKKEYKSMHPQYRPLPQIPLHNVNIGQPKTSSASSTNVAQNGSNVDDATSSQVITTETGQTYRVTRYSALGNNSSGNSSFLDTSLNISTSGDSIGSKLDSSGSRYGSSSSPAAGAAGKSTFFYSPATGENNTPLPNAANVSPSLSNASSLTRRIIAVANNDVVSTMSPTNERRHVPASAALLKGREMAVDVPPSISTLPSSSLSRANTAAAAAAGSLETKAGGEGLQRDAGASSSSSSTLTQTASMTSGGTVGSAALTQTPGSSLDARRSTVAVATWTNHHIKQMLLSLGLAHHVAAFEANGIDGNKLLEIGLDSEKLKQIGVFDRHERHLIKKKVKELRIVLARERRAMQRTRAAREQRQQQQQHAMLLESLMPPMPLVLSSAVPPDSPSILKAESSSMPPVLAVPLTKSASTTASSATAAIKRRLLGRGRQSRTSADGANAITASGSSVGSTTSSTAAAASVALNAKKKTRSASAQPVAATSAKVSKTTATRNGDAAVQVKEH